jgi:hypothetical protein
MHWLGERFEPTQLDFQTVPRQHGLEDPKIAATTGVHGESVGRWRSLLSPAEVEAVDAGTAELRAPFGHGRDQWRRGG